MLIDYFTSRRGKNIQTLGIWVLNKIFIHNGKAILLMDTQGIFDQELSQIMTIALISLSTIISSYQIYNLNKQIQEDYLCNMANFSSYTSSISNINNNTKIGVTICLLVRDWEYFNNNFDINACNIETYKNELLYNNTLLTTEQQHTRRKIFDIYNNILVRLCPYPGYLVT
jgi:atlastin